MQRTMLKSKIHRATVTQADLNYVGSVTIDEDLMHAADLLPGEQVAIVDINNGQRLETYVIPGPAGTGVIGINGAAARLVLPEDLVIIISYATVDDTEARELAPRIVHVDARNRVTGIGHSVTDLAAPAAGSRTTRGDAIAKPHVPAQAGSPENGGENARVVMPATRLASPNRTTLTARLESY